MDQLVVHGQLNWDNGKLYSGNIVYGKDPLVLSDSVRYLLLCPSLHSTQLSPGTESDFL